MAMPDRNDVTAAARVAHQILPDDEQRALYARILSADALAAAGAGEQRWSVTLFPRHITMNVGAIFSTYAKAGTGWVSVIVELDQVSEPTRTKLAGGQGFVAQLLQLALPADFAQARLVPYADEGDAPGERLRASTQLIWADWPSADVTADGFLFGRADGRTDGRPTHCLTPAPVLRAAAAMVARAWEAKHPEAHAAESEARPALIVAVRRDVSMRNLAPADEASLLSELRNLAAEVHWELVVFDGSAGIAGGVPLFRRARAVVGVHGGALSNVLFSAHDSAENGRVLLVELTVASRIAAHYAHAAAALGLRFKIFDAFRPSEAQWALWNFRPDPDFLADPRRGSPHSRGVAVDLALIDGRTGQELDFGTGFDEFTHLSYHADTAIRVEAQRNRLLLLGLMSAAGWDFYSREWWHYQLFDSRRYPVLSDSVLGQAVGGPLMAGP
jgi:D-alanyl-D-alanine dipeptidase